VGGLLKKNEHRIILIDPFNSLTFKGFPYTFKNLDLSINQLAGKLQQNHYRVTGKRLTAIDVHCTSRSSSRRMMF